LRSADGAQVAALGNQGHRRQSRHIYWRAGMSASYPYRTRTVQDCLQRKFIIEPHFAGRKSLM